jgi:hypothetical protein
MALSLSSISALAGEVNDQGPNAAIGQLYELQAAFHAAAGGAGVDAATKAQHLQEMLDIWTADGVLIIGSTVYSGRGDPNDSTCAPGSLTICDFFQHHAGSFVLGRNWAALTSISRTHFDVHGNSADVYFECHYFDVAAGVKTSDASIGLLGQPNTGQARRVGGKWLLSFAVAGSPPLSSE